MLTLSGGQVESLFDLGSPVEVAELPEDLAELIGWATGRCWRRSRRCGRPARAVMGGRRSRWIGSCG